MENKIQRSHIEKANFLPLVCYGIHTKYQESLFKKIRTRFDLKSIFIYEYFLLNPVVKSDNPVELDKLIMHGPFLLRILNEAKFIPHITDKSPQKFEEIKEKPWLLKDVIDFWTFKEEIPAKVIVKDSIIMKRLLEHWREERQREHVNEKDCRGWIDYEKSSGIAKANLKFSIDYFKKDYLNFLLKLGDRSYWGGLKEYMTVVLPWLRQEEKKLTHLNIGALSISSKKICYGEILIFYPAIGIWEQRDIFTDEEGNESQFIKYLKKFIKDTYVPVLFLFEEMWEERELEREIDKEPAWERYIFLNQGLKNSNESMERAIHDLWIKRKEIYEENYNRDKACDKIKESLLFSRYAISSIAMVNEIKKIVVPRMRRKGGFLPCFLVIGGPGSGKDTMAKIVQLFFPEYRFGKRYVINMAQLKPNYLSVPLMSGGEMEIIRLSEREKFKEASSLEIKLKGLFQKIWERHKREHVDTRTTREKGMMPVVILDELNSLDIDAQGALLRILENARLQSLGGPEEGEEIDFLIIGIVNEQEKVLTLEDSLRTFLAEKNIFGGLLGKIFYEYFRNLRRLREDLFHRLIRDGKITLPDLRSRKEDIPVLFAIYVKQAIPLSVGWDNLWFDFDIFKELTREKYHWSGNFRTLQSLAKKAVVYALEREGNREFLEKYRGDNKGAGFFIVTMNDVDKAIEEMELR